MVVRNRRRRGFQCQRMHSFLPSAGKCSVPDNAPAKPGTSASRAPDQSLRAASGRARRTTRHQFRAYIEVLGTGTRE